MSNKIRHNSDTIVPTTEEVAAYQQNLPGVLERLAQPHLTGYIQHLPHNPSKYPFQDPMLHHVQGRPISLKEADGISPIAQPGYLQERERIQKSPDIEKIIAQIGDILQAKGNIVVVTPHDQLIDVVMASLVVRDLLLLADESYTPQSTAVILSKMVTQLQYSVSGLTIPAIQVIQLFCHDIYLSFPRTVTAKEVVTSLPKGMVKRNNQLMAQDIHDNFAQGGVLLGLAATGTTRKTINPETGKEEFAQITAGTAKIMTAPNTFVLPVELTVGSTFSVNTIGHPTKLTRLDDIATFMNVFKPESDTSANTTSSLGSIALTQPN